MSVQSQIQLLDSIMAQDCEILADPADAKFQEYSKRWSDIDRQIPAAIVLPQREEDIAKILKWATGSSIPFVVKGGGHSTWSTVGNHGFVIDLTRFSAVEVDATARTATLRGGVIQKELAVRLAEVGLFTALGNGNTVGVIGYLLGGGSALTNSITGYGSDQIISARLVTANGEVVEVTDDLHSDFLWAIRGAGHFFGLVTQLVIKTYPVSLLGSDNGTFWLGSFVFPLERAEDVASVMKPLMNDGRYATSGLMMIMAPPPARRPSIVIAARYTGDPVGAQIAYKPLYELGPLIANGSQVPIQNASDGREAIGAKGDFKRFGIVGLHSFEVDRFLQCVDVWKELITECPDAINTAFNSQWDSRPVKRPEFDSAMSLHDIRYWQNNLIWHTNPNNRKAVDEFNDRSLVIMRGQNDEEWVDYQNGTREDPIERRFRGEERLERLRRLKKLWDPTGVFTTQLLE